MKSLATLIVVLTISTGCGHTPNPVAGSVTYKGKPVAQGFITFFPTSGTGTSLGANINEGRYEFADVPPGPYRLLITSLPKVEGTEKLKLTPTPTIPTKAPGNNQQHDITPKQRTLDITISWGRFPNLPNPQPA